LTFFDKLKMGGGLWGMVFSGETSLIIQLSLIVLVLFSIVSLAIILHKIRLLRKIEKENIAFKEIFGGGKQFKAVFEACSSFKFTPLAKLFFEGYKELQQVKKLPALSAVVEHNATLDRKIKPIERVLRKVSSREVNSMEKAVTFLATTANTTPFIGLFGTVWGIMSAFSSISMKGSASLITIAPGISEALTTTALGLIAAIPAVVAYNHLSTKIDRIVLEMDNFSTDFLTVAERYILKDLNKGGAGNSGI